MNISVITAVKGNPQHVFESLESVNDIAAEIIVADLGMDEAIRKRLQNNPKVTIVSVRKQVLYIELIREDLKSHAKQDYILFLDPDEILSDGLKELIRKHLHSYDYFSIPRKNIIFGRWMEHSRWWPDYQIRLFKKNAVSWPKRIHAQPEVTGKEYKVAADEKKSLIHYNYHTIDEFLEKLLRYTKSDAHERVQSGKPFTLRIALNKSLTEFVSRFLAHDGYKDGMHGFVLAVMQIFYYFLVYFYYWEEKKYFNVETKELVKETGYFFRQGLYETNHWVTEKNIPDESPGFARKLLNVFIKRFF